MQTLQPTETRSDEAPPRRSIAVVAIAVAIFVVVGAAIAIWAVTNNGGPVAAEDARIELTFTGDDASYVGDREIIEGLADAVLINDSAAPVWFILEYFEPGSADLNLDRYPEGTDFFPDEDMAGDPRLMENFEPGRVTRSIRLEPGTYTVEAAVADEDTTHVWRFAVIEVVSDGGSSGGSSPNADVPSVSFREGDVPGVRVWQLPDAPGGYQPDQSWLAIGSDPDGHIYISGHDHVLNSMLYSLDPETGNVTWVGDARTASTAADNWEPGETAEKFHTRPTYHDGRMYVATLDKSSINDAFLSTRGFHWYAYDLASGDFIDLSADEPGGVGDQHLQVVTIQADTVNDRVYGMTIPENQLLYYDVAQGRTTVVGTPDQWQGYFYSNRFMWTDSRGSVYMTGGTERSQWNQGEDRSVLDSVWRYDPDSGFEDTGFALQTLAAIEVGQWNSAHDRLYVSDDMGHIYRFTDATATWEYLGRPDFPAGETSSGFNKVWVFQLDPGEETIYLGRSDNSGRPNEIWEFDINTGSSSILAALPDLDTQSGREAFITGYDSWDSDGNFYIASFSMYDSENTYLIGLNPEQIRTSILPE